MLVRDFEHSEKYSRNEIKDTSTDRMLKFLKVSCCWFG